MAELIDTDAFRKRHHPVNPVRYDGDTDGLVTDGPAVCPRCATQGWPCDASRLADEVDRLRAENAALRALVARFYTQAWEDPLTDDEMALLDPIVNEAQS